MIWRLYPPVGRSPANSATTEERLKSTGGRAGGGSKRLAWRRQRASHSARLVMSAASCAVMPLWLPRASVVNVPVTAGAPQAVSRVSRAASRQATRVAGIAARVGWNADGAVRCTVRPPSVFLLSFPEVRVVEPGRRDES